MKILVIGLDCAAPEILLADERLTNIRAPDGRAAATAGWKASIPPITVPAWMCMSTSQDPGLARRLRVPQPHRSFVRRRSASSTRPRSRRWRSGTSSAREGTPVRHHRRAALLSAAQGQRHQRRLLPDARHHDRTTTRHPARVEARDRTPGRRVPGRRQGLPHRQQGLAARRDLRHDAASTSRSSAT